MRVLTSVRDGSPVRLQLGSGHELRLSVLDYDGSPCADVKLEWEVPARRTAPRDRGAVTLLRARLDLSDGTYETADENRLSLEELRAVIYAMTCLRESDRTPESERAHEKLRREFTSRLEKGRI